MINDLSSSAIGTPAPTKPQFLSLDELRNRCPAAFAAKPHPKVSEKYAFVPTTEIVAKLDEYGYKPVSAVNPVRKRDGKTGPLVPSETGPHLVYFEPEVPTSSLRTKEGRVQVVLTNSHDRSRRFSLAAGFFRLVCSNGMVSFQPEMSMRSTHITSDAGRIYEEIERTINQTGRLLDTVHAMQKTTLSRSKQLALAKQAMGIRFGNPRLWRIEATQLLDARRDDDEGDDLWRVFNRIQENMVRGGIHNPRTPMPTMPLTRPRQTFNMNAALWTAAESFLAK